MGKTVDKRSKEISEAGFPYHWQRHLYGCGLASLRMLADWSRMLPGTTEDYWKANSEWKPGKGLPPAGMRRALRSIPGLSIRKLPTTAQVAAWQIDGSPPPDDMFQDSIYLLATDSYGTNGENAGHWLILLGIFDSSSGKSDVPPPEPLALCADPWERGKTISVWTWRSLLASRVTRAFRITRKPAV